MDHGERIANPPRHYGHPSSILTDNELTKDEQIIALKNWRNDIELKSVATDENMGVSCPDVTLIAEIDNLLNYLEHQSS